MMRCSILVSILQLEPSVVENAIQFGKEVIQKGGEEIEHIYENVRVLTDKISERERERERVISVRQQTIKGKGVKLK
ncbi:MAG: hypothetical protein UW39_C0021G0003 [Parcubacteria group bacterium GW2011_GWC2_44_17]|nr:MAG: hypothetical protein UW39_C0021G0003 [Parcubacteria group bacterium GW2011_GWC2_44_17]HCE87032.1 hypothetical protein [Candidatus Jacksonbacteria bacterium]